jgi:hypothetical protein
MLSFRVKALLQTGQWTLFSPVCFFPWRAAWPDVVKVAVHACDTAYGQGYLFFSENLGFAVELSYNVTVGDSPVGLALLRMEVFRDG